MAYYVTKLVTVLTLFFADNDATCLFFIYSTKKTQKIHCYASDVTQKIHCYANNVTQKTIVMQMM